MFGSGPPAAADDYANQIRPFLKTNCLGCHSTKAKKGGLDMERFATLEQVRADVEPWQVMLQMLENDEMPPEESRALRRQSADGSSPGSAASSNAKPGFEPAIQGPCWSAV